MQGSHRFLRVTHNGESISELFFTNAFLLQEHCPMHRQSTPKNRESDQVARPILRLRLAYQADEMRNSHWGAMHRWNHQRAVRGPYPQKR